MMVYINRAQIKKAWGDRERNSFATDALRPLIKIELYIWWVLYPIWRYKMF